MAGGSRTAAAMARPRIEIDWADMFNFGSPSSSPESWRGVSSRRRRHPWVQVEEPPCRIERRAVPEAAAAKADDVGERLVQEDGRDGESSPAPPAKKSRKLDTEKEDVILHMLGEINKSLQASLKPAEPLQAPKETSPEEIFEALRERARLARADRLRAYSMLTQDDRRFRSLMALPKNMKKELLLMEIGSI